MKGEVLCLGQGKKLGVVSKIRCRMSRDGYLSASKRETNSGENSAGSSYLLPASLSLWTLPRRLKTLFLAPETVASQLDLLLRDRSHNPPRIASVSEKTTTGLNFFQTADPDSPHFSFDNQTSSTPAESQLCSLSFSFFFFSRFLVLFRALSFFSLFFGCVGVMLLRVFLSTAIFFSLCVSVKTIFFWAFSARLLATGKATSLFYLFDEERRLHFDRLQLVSGIRRRRRHCLSDRPPVVVAQRRAAKRGVSSKSSASSPGVNTVSSDSTVHPVKPRGASRSSLQSFRLSFMSQKRAKTDAMETPPDSGQPTHPQRHIASPSSPSSPSPSSSSSSSPPVEGRLRSDASAGSLPACMAGLSSQVAPFVSFPSLQRQQTEQLVKSLDFHVYLWGLNDKGQILNGAFGVSSPATPADKDADRERRETESGRESEGTCSVPLTSGPSRVTKLQHKTIAGMSCSAANTFIWDFHDLLWAGGSTEIGLELLGMDLDDEGRDEGVVPRASLCETLGDVKMVAASRTHAVAVLENGGK
ncbi:hypothetical protein TGGT1_222440 [Toxoplasma gondii GT1]|uniref:Transmembrane protein n=1 Tax=Toxoplasma gondii (strain ATCC 50853 / GT1) TaxID=507601 RepID=S7UK29_TOXGG|nr:hypothetical protein TGGT1_222440 [Toxoplasma gondii GT1]